MSLLEQLNEQQYEAVTCVNQHLRIIAGAGSGKTRVVTTRIAYLIEQCHIYPNKILAITFTNKAAKEMKERVESFLHDQGSAVMISTIHSFCVRLLREDIYTIGYPRNFTIIDSDDQRSILKDAYKKLEIDVKSYSYANTLAYISNNKTNFVDAAMAQTYAQNSYSLQQEVLANIYEYYEKELKKMLALDFDDLLIFAYHILKNDIDVRRKWQNRFSYIHVDEFQDVDVLQYEIIKNLVKEDSILCVVGDPDQTIYTWRGAQVDIIMNFHKDFVDTKTIILNENYRSTKPILSVANALIKNNQNRIDKDLFTRNTNEDKVLHFSAADDQNEPLWVAGKMKNLHKDGVAYHDMAILYRSNYLSRALEKALLELHIPYRIYGGTRFYDRMEIKDALSYLRLLCPKTTDDPQELYKNLAVKRIVNVPKRGVGPKSLSLIEEAALQQGSNMYEVIKQGTICKGKAKASLEAFVEIIERNRALVEEISMDQLLQKVLNEVGYIKMLNEDAEIERLENVKELINDMADYVESHPQASIIDYLQDISLYTDKEAVVDSDFVQLMTVHAAKGLEFNHVFVYELCEGIFPSQRSVDEGGIEEERRLAYVAFTRAKQRLYLCDSAGYSFMLDRIKTPSRFIREIPKEWVEEVNKRASNHFSSDIDVYNGQGFMSKKSLVEQTTTSSNVASGAKKKGKIRKGDVVLHASFGEGVVLKIDDGLATIAFAHKFGIRKIMADHPSIIKK